ncbi:lysosome-associated membrane glycoprotein 3-like [Acanthaster planci]|uniref:Lysosome-associated membrane glycoprotein 3-like n=1 Tax=Acanthaster planci TaxID=133434 RepID=A0A8B7Y4Q7_ACAPL|nr:lysosome-associated membrane glycoprotein 3-like [Acanthaster planci]
MNVSFFCLFLAMAGAVTLASGATMQPPKKTTVVSHTSVPKTTGPHSIAPKTTSHHTTAAPKTTAHHTTSAPKTTSHHTTAAPKTTSHHTTAAPKTTAHHTTAAPKTTSHHTTAAPKTTAHHTTAAPKTTAHHSTAAPKTTARRSTALPGTTSQHTPGNITESPINPTGAPGNTTSNGTGSTFATTEAAATTISEQRKVIPSYLVRNGTDVCMLFVLNATLIIQYNTTDNKRGEAIIHVGGDFNATGAEWTANGSFCRYEVQRFLSIKTQYDVPGSNASGSVALTSQFVITSLDEVYYELGLLSVGWKYYEPFFPRNVVDYGKEAIGVFPNVYEGTVGKTFGCQTMRFSRGPVTLILDHMMFQPYADFANGTFGDVEHCKEKPTTANPSTEAPTDHPPTKPSPNNGGKIAGIVIGVLAAVVIIIGVAVYVVRRRRLKGISYGNLESDKDYVH